MKVTARQLRELGACPDQVDLFESLFGSEVDVTEALCVQYANEFDWRWAALKLLPTQTYEEYERVRAPAWAEYLRVRDTAWEEYERMKAPAWAKFEYKRVRASTFGRLAEGVKP